MESTGQRKTASLIQQEISIIFQRKSREYLNKMISVTIVRMTPDLGYAKIYLSIFPEQQKDEVFEMIIKSSSNLRFELGNRIKNKVRKIPEIQFYIDDSLEYVEKINDLLKT
ncbi:MAG: 30S ribosome-binding factor RbfA [Bacteroidales bacterium]|nr:30S ribosome-binding factor RbfA [Bacteroidales bacterium]